MKHESKEVYNRKDEHNNMIETMDSIVGGWGRRVHQLEQALQKIKAVAGSNCQDTTQFGWMCDEIAGICDDVLDEICTHCGWTLQMWDGVWTCPNCISGEVENES